MLRKILTGALVFLFIFGFLVFYSPPAKAIKDFSVEVTPRRAGSVARYALTMSFEKKLGVHEWLHVNFPKGTTLTPPLPEEDEHQRKLRLKQITESISYGSPCPSCMGLPIIVFESNGTLTMKFHLTGAVDPTKEGYQSITITILESAGFTNPPIAGNYIFKFKNQQEPTFVESTPVTIEESKISKPMVTMQNPIINQISGYDIEFRTGSAGKLGFRTNVIYLAFPPGTEIPTPPNEILYQLVTINGYPILLSPAIDLMKLTFFLPFTINDASDIKIHIDPKWGIKNPRNPGKYKFKVYTSTDQDPVESDEIEINQGPNELQLDIAPAKTNKVAEYTMTLVAGKGDLLPGETCQLFFPDLVKLPKTINPQFVTVQGKKVNRIEMDQSLISIELIETIPQGSGIEIKILSGAGITNPKIECQLGMVIAFTRAKLDFISNLVEIQNQEVEIKKLQIIPPNEGEKASYRFNLVFNDRLIPSIGDEIEIQFSFLSRPIVLKVTEKLSEETILTLPDIQNPSAGHYTVQINSNKEKSTKKEEIWIIPPRPVTKINVTGGKIGKNGWYVEVPLIGFETTDPEALICIYWNDPKYGILNYSGQSMPPDPGQYITKLYYFSTNAYGQEDPKSVEIKVDCVNPYINSIFPENNKIQINKNELTIEGKVSPIKTIVYGADKIEPDRNLTIQDKSVEVRDDGSFFYDATLLEGINEITVHLEDDAGRYVEKKYTVLLDSIPPKLEVVYPIQNATILEKKMLLRGKTESSAVLVINGEFVLVEEDGSFSKEISLSRVGVEQVEIIATDSLSNTTTRIVQFFYGYTIQLKIGSTTAKNNTIEKKMVLAPSIQKGRTLLPFRFIGEELKAKVGYQVDQKTKAVQYVTYELGTLNIKLTIGSMKATVNGKEVALDAPVQLIKNTTVVPLRFVAENLGCSVEWEPIYQTITIQYPK